MKRIVIVLLVAVVCLAYSSAHAQDPTPTPSQTTPLRVGTKQLEPFAMRQDNRWTGFSIELWEIIAEDLRLNYEWVDYQTVDELLNAVKDGQVDAAISAISMTPEREALIDFSHPHFQAGLQILVPKQEQSDLTSLAQVIFSPLLFQTIALGVIITLVIAHIIWLTERGSNPDMPTGYVRGVWEATWWAVLTLTSATYGTGTPTTTLKRILAMVWIVLGILLVAQFTASIAAVLTVDQLTSEIAGPSDLPGKAIGTLRGSTAARYLEQEALAYVEANSVEEMYQLLRDGQVQAVVFDAPILEYFANTRGKGEFQVVGPIFHPEEYGIAMPIGSSLREEINKELLRLGQDGRYDALLEKWFGEPQ